MVREHLPNLAQLMRHRNLYTLTAITEKCTRIIPAVVKIDIYTKLWSLTPEALRAAGENSKVADVLSSVFLVKPAEILAERAINYALLRGKTTSTHASITRPAARHG